MAIAVLVLGLVPGPATARDDEPADVTSMSLEQLSDVQVVYAASRYEQRAVDAPASVTIVSSEEIERFGARNLGEVLDHVRGLYVTRDQNYTYLGIRGFGEPGDENRRVLVMVNGHRLNESVFDYAGLGADFPIPLGVVDRIEVIRGPGSSVYGTNALLGVINVVTRDPQPVAGARVTLGGGNQSASQGTLDLSRAVGGGAAVEVAGSWFGSHGGEYRYPEFVSGPTGSGIARGLDGTRSGTGYARLTWRDVEIQSGVSSERKDVPTAPFGTLFGISTRTWDHHAFLDAAWRPSLGDSSGLVVRASANSSRYDGQYPYDHSDTGTPVSLFRDYGAATWLTVGTQLTSRTVHDHTIVAGTEARADLRLDQGAADELGVYTRVRKTASTWGLFAQDDWAAAEFAHLSLGLRYDRYSSFGGQFTPRAAVVVSPATATRVKLLYGRAFRAPNSFELDYEGGGNKAAHALSPELIDTYEFALEQGLGARVALSASVFGFQAHDLLAQEIDPADSLIVFRNSGRVEARGAEIELRVRPGEGWEFTGSYSRQDARDANTDATLVNSPRDVAKASVLTPAWHGADAALALRGVGRRPTLAGERTAPYLLVDLSARHRLPGGRLTLNAAVWNLTGATYGDPGAQQHVQDVIPQDGRTWRAFVAMRFGR